MDSIPLDGVDADLIQQGLQDLASSKHTITEARYAIMAMFCLQIYEWVAGIDKEVRLIHKASWTSLKTLYLLCRYYPLALWGVLIWAYVLDHDAHTCQQVAGVVHSLLFPCQCFSQAVMLMRAYAFSGRNWRTLALLGTCYLGLVGLDIWVFCTHVDIPPEIFYTVLHGSGCFPNYGADVMAFRIGYSMIAAISMDLLSLGVVVVHCFRSRWERDVSLARYFVSQGLSAFAFVLFINVATAVSYFRPPRYHDGVGLPLILCVSNLVACRVILELRAKVTPTDSEISRQNSFIVRNAFLAPHEDSDSWAIDSPAHVYN